MLIDDVVESRLHGDVDVLLSAALRYVTLRQSINKTVTFVVTKV